MKRLLLSLGLVLAMVACTNAAILEWDMEDMNTVTGFKIYRGSATGVYDQTVISVNTSMCTGTAPTHCIYEYFVPNGKWYWVVTAVAGTVGESAYSNEVNKQYINNPKNGKVTK